MYMSKIFIVCSNYFNVQKTCCSLHQSVIDVDNVVNEWDKQLIRKFLHYFFPVLM